MLAARNVTGLDCTVMNLSFWQIGLGSLFAIPFAPFWQNNLRFSLFVRILGSLQQKFLVSKNLGTLQ